MRFIIWQARIKVNKIEKHLGYFDTKEEAVIRRNNFILENNMDEKIQDVKWNM